LTQSIDRDVQNEKPSLSLAINRIGVKGVHRRITIRTSTQNSSYDVELDAFIDLPKNQRGAHMSRIVEAILEAIDGGNRSQYENLEELLEAMCRMLLSKNPYAKEAGIEAKTIRYFETYSNFANEKIPEAVNVKHAVSMLRGREPEWKTGISMEGLTVCPCVQAVHSALEESDPNGSLSHTQRTRVTVEVKTGSRPVPVEWLVEAAATAFSAPILSLLKRRQEYELIKAAFKNPRFVEDVVRHVLSEVAGRLRVEGYPLETEILIKAESYESVHPFNAHACTRATLGQVIYELASDCC
jgi:GTP cyclohydrolase FolE2